MPQVKRQRLRRAGSLGWREAPWQLAAAHIVTVLKPVLEADTEGREGRDSCFAFSPFAKFNVPVFILIKSGSNRFLFACFQLKAFQIFGDLN